MDKPNVYFIPINGSNTKDVSMAARRVFEKTRKDLTKPLSDKVPVKIHVGEPGNTSYIKPENFKGVIKLLKKHNPYFVETCTVGGSRSTGTSHSNVAKKHGFTQIPFIMADGENGTDYVEVPVAHGKHFKKAKIARKLAEAKWFVVLSHFKGHIASGYGAALKNLGIGFASRIGKIEQHSRDIPYHMEIDGIKWDERDKLYDGDLFSERVAEYAQAAVKNKQCIYVNFALSLVENCDCDGMAMKPIYNDLGILSSTDPVAVDKACFDLLIKREDKKPFAGDRIFEYAEKIGIGSSDYKLIRIED